MLKATNLVPSCDKLGTFKISSRTCQVYLEWHG